jgi:hypothetical protein
MALSLSLGEPRPFRFGLVFSLHFNALPPNTAKTQTRDLNDADGNIARTRSRRVARADNENQRICEVGSRSVSLRKQACVEVGLRPTVPDEVGILFSYPLLGNDR